LNEDGTHKFAERTRALTLAAMSLGFGVVQLDVTIVNTALNAIGSGFGGGMSALQWVVNAYTIGFAALILTAGALGDRFDAKRMFIGGFALFTLASSACAVAPSLHLLIAARAAQGVAAATLVPNSLALLNHAYPEANARGRAVGVWAAGASVALTAGPLAGGVLIALVGWRAIFLVNVPVGLVGLSLTWRFAGETPTAGDRRLDLPGQAAAILALGILAGAMIEGGKLGWRNALVLGGLAAAGVLAALFVLQERRAVQPMLPLQLFKRKAFASATLIGVLANTAFYGLIFVLSLYFQQIDGLSPFQTGLAFTPMLGVVLPVNLLAPRLSERLGAPGVIAIGALIASAGALGLLVAHSGTPYAWLCAQLVALGGGLGLLVPPMTAMLLGSVDRSYSGIASGVLNSARQTGSVVGVALFGAFVASGLDFAAGMKASLAIAAGLLVASAGVAILGRERRQSRVRGEEREAA